jgi:group I intron endonuclease
METFGFIYKITNLLNGKIYVGQTTQRPAKRWASHKAGVKNPKWPIHRAIARHGAENFDFAVIEECQDRETLDQAECRWIAELRSKKPGGYNVTDGGGGINGYKFSAEACAKLGDRSRGRHVSQETGRKISEAKRGQRLGDETRRRMAAARIGKKHSPEVREKIARSNRGKKRSDAHKEQLRQFRLGFRHTDEAKAKFSRRVLAAGTEYKSLLAAAEALGVSTTTIQRRVSSAHDGYASIDPIRPRRMTALCPA